MAVDVCGREIPALRFLRCCCNYVNGVCGYTTWGRAVPVQRVGSSVGSRRDGVLKISTKHGTAYRPHRCILLSNTFQSFGSLETL